MKMIKKVKKVWWYAPIEDRVVFCLLATCVTYVAASVFRWAV